MLFGRHCVAWLIGPHLRHGTLETVMDSDRVLSIDIHAVWPQSRYLPSKTRVAIDALAAKIPSMVGYGAAISTGVPS